MGNCFRVRGFVYNVETRDITQFEGTGTLFDVLAQLVYYTSRFRDVIQQVVIEQVLDEDICVENAVLEELSILAADPSVDLDEEERRLRQKYDSYYRGEYSPPKVKLEHEGGVLKRIIIEAGE